jgi:hypothetical protein
MLDRLVEDRWTMFTKVSRRFDISSLCPQYPVHVMDTYHYLSPSYNIRLGLSQSANPKLFLRNTHHLSRLGKLPGRLVDGVERHLPSSPVHSDSLLRVLSSAKDYF